MASVTSRYARAFADVVLARNLNTEKIRQQLAELLATVKSSPELRRVLDTPAITLAQKIELLNVIAARLALFPEVRNFTAVLIQHRRIGQLQQVVTQFERELNQRLGIADAEVSSARELGPDERRTLESQIERLTGKRVQARYSIDSALLGGAVVRLGSTIYDGSVRGQLNKIREQLSAG